MKQKKWFGILAAVLALALALAGCQSGTSPSGSLSASGSESQSQALEYVELEYYLAEKEPTDGAMVWDAKSTNI